MALSSRGQEMAIPQDKNRLWDVIKDIWHPETNPSGYLNLGVAENALLQERLLKHALDSLNINVTTLTYGDGPAGSRHLKAAMAGFLTKYLRPVQPLRPDHITITNGCSSAIEHLVWLLGNPGDAILLGQPCFRGFWSFIESRTGTKIITIPFSSTDPFTSSAVASYEAAILRAREQNQPLSALLLCNPHNPTGRCYTRDAIIGLMRLCQAHDLHLISDEIYALSTWPNPLEISTPFTSVLAIDTTGLIDPARVHVVWGISKDFGANGLRLGSILSTANPAVHRAIVPIAGLSSCSSVTERIATNFLSDSVWAADYVEENRRLLAETYTFMVSWADRHRIPYARGASAAFFFMVNLGDAYATAQGLGETTAAVEDELNTKLLDRRVFVVKGSICAAEEPGWFRIVFAYDRAILEEGLRRIIEVIEGK
ncbi:pyridoxal phosphate-dependent transferase [Plectosphaerella cucumerina]|uniref:Pyridoxal phosphate-dependent transferase n=1 Tax=Plectosphaerella cucumerina TaxID=40658 RepID=A0A8K0TAN1_9PEZI|nr:pyridoxal phosphate-dependent transferase [Plectosphaerella cucumerina]